MHSFNSHKNNLEHSGILRNQLLYTTKTEQCDRVITVKITRFV